MYDPFAHEKAQRERWRSILETRRRVENIFHQVRLLEYNRQTAFLIRACGDDVKLIADIEEMLRAKSLAILLEGGPLYRYEFFSSATAICSELDFVHRCGVIHGDINPENILLGRGGNVWFLNFRVDAPPDQGIDIVALGAILRKMTARADEIPQSKILRLIEKASNSNPLQRYKTAAQAGSDLRQIESDMEAEDEKARCKKESFPLVLLKLPFYWLLAVATTLFDALIEFFERLLPDAPDDDDF